MEPGGDTRRKQYECDVTYGTNSEFGFDYLRDNMKERNDLQVQGSLDFAIVDEVDSILIDEARTPLIISGAAHDDAPKYKRADEVARKVMELNKPWAAVEKQVDAAKRAIKAAEGDIDKAKGDKKVIEAARKRRRAGREGPGRGRGEEGRAHPVLRGRAGPQERQAHPRGLGGGAGDGRASAASSSATTWNGRT